jgi:hypothetical protein
MLISVYILSVSTAVDKAEMCVRGPFLQANCEYIMNHGSNTDDPDFVFLPGFAEVAQDLWTEEILPLFDGSSSFRLADNAE